MPGVTNFNFAARIRAAVNQRRVLRWQRALGKNTAGTFDHLIEGQVDRDERAKHRVEMRHQNRSRNSLARHVAEYEVQRLVVTSDQVAIVTTDRASRLVVIGNFPAINLLARRRER